MAKLEAVVRKLKESPTFFELMTAAAFLHFSEQEVDYAVIETGLGGRLDATNVLKPEAVGITSISFDHMAQLGRTLEAIAAEAGRHALHLARAERRALREALRLTREPVSAPTRE